MSSIRVLLPLPLGPVMAVSVPSGMATLMFLRLLWRGPMTSIIGRFARSEILDFGFWILDLARFESKIGNPKSKILRFDGTAIAFLPLKYGPVTEPAAFASFSGTASATI